MKIVRKWFGRKWGPSDWVTAGSVYAIFFLYFYLVTGLLPLSLLFALAGLVVVPHIRKRRRREKEKRLMLEFQDFLYGFTNHVTTGKSLENSVVKGKEDILTIYGDNSLLKSHLEDITRNFNLGSGLDKGFIQLGKDYESKAIETFGEMIGVGREKGGDLIGILKRTGEVLTEQMEVEREIETLLAKQNMEIKILRGMPFLLILLLKFIYPDMISILTGSLVGVLILIVAGGLIGAAYYYSNKLMEVIW